MRSNPKAGSSVPLRSGAPLGILALSYAFGVGAAPTSPRPAETGREPAAPCGITPETVPLRPTQNAPGGRGAMTLVMPESPFGVTVEADGRYVFDVTVEVSSLRRRDGLSYVVWAATPELDQVVRLGLLDDALRVTGRVSWNKFLVFVSEEASPEPERWSGPILLTGLSPSGRMHTMAGHGPFEGVECENF